LYPSDLQTRASAEKWMDWTTSTLAEPFKAVFWGVVRTPAQKQNWDSINAGRQACIDALSTVDDALAEQPYLSGETFGMGDIPLGCFIYAWFEMPIERPATAPVLEGLVPAPATAPGLPQGGHDRVDLILTINTGDCTCAARASTMPVMRRR